MSKRRKAPEAPPPPPRAEGPTARFRDAYGFYRDVDALDMMAKTYDWRMSTMGRVFMSPEPHRLAEHTTPMMARPTMADAIRSLTREEMIHLYDSLIESHRKCLADGGDFTPPWWRREFPHLYPDEQKKDK